MKNKTTLAPPRACGAYCAIYEYRPVDPCRHSICAWLREPCHLSDWLRHVHVKVIVLGVRSWRALSVDVAAPVGKRIPGNALNWLKFHAFKHGRPPIYTEQAADKLVREQMALGFSPPKFQQEIQALVQQGNKLW